MKTALPSPVFLYETPAPASCQPAQVLSSGGPLLAAPSLLPVSSPASAAHPVPQATSKESARRARILRVMGPRFCKHQARRAVALLPTISVSCSLRDRWFATVWIAPAPTLDLRGA